MRTYFFALVILSAVLLAHMFGLTGAYVDIDGYDIMMHILGGVGIGLFVAAILKLHGQHVKHPRLTIIFWVIIAGLLWEFFEIYYDLIGYPFGTKGYWVDTIKDMIDDTIGGAVVAWITNRKHGV
ncbi:MAG: hypothetical protein AAB365_02550 [Patescibacteria group bacterium]